MYQRMHRYPIGTRNQSRTGYIFIKTEKRGWIAEARLIAEMKLSDHELESNERVFHKDGNRENNKPENLAVIRFNTTKYKLLPTSRPLFIPSAPVTQKEILRMARAA